MECISKKLLSGFLICLACALWFPAYAADKPVKSSCKADIEWQVTPEAEITQFDCKQGNHKGKPALIFTAGLKNISKKPLRYRVNIFLLDMDKAVGHLVPRKGKPPVLEPGKTANVTIPSIGTKDMSKKIMVIVKTLSVE